jgi:hypothetical protein
MITKLGGVDRDALFLLIHSVVFVLKRFSSFALRPTTRIYRVFVAAQVFHASDPSSVPIFFPRARLQEFDNDPAHCTPTSVQLLTVFDKIPRFFHVSKDHKNMCSLDVSLYELGSPHRDGNTLSCV